MISLVSIIIPAYNAENAIATSVFSALFQTWKNVEVLVVDDGSTDNTAALIAEIQKTDARIKLIKHEKNRGSLVARITGVDASSGQFVVFLDADDYLDENAIEVCLSKKDTDGQNFDITQFGFKLHYAKPQLTCDKEWADNYYQPPTKTCHGANISHLIFRDQNAPWSLCGKLFRASIVKQAVKLIPTQKLTMAEDACMSFFICAFAKSYIGLPGLRAYNYNIDSGRSSAVERNVNIEQFKKYCEYASAMHVIKNFVETLGNSQELVQDYVEIKNTHIDACISKLIESVKRNEKPDAFKILLDSWGAVEVITRLAAKYDNNARACIKDLCLETFFREANYATRGSSLQHSATHHPATLPCAAQLRTAQNCTPPHSTTPAPVKTIAIYYVRIHTGGAEKVTVALINLWLKMQYRVVLFTDEAPCEIDYKINENIPRVVLPFSGCVSAGKYRKRAEVLEEAIKKYSIDTLVYCSFIGRLITWDMLLAKALGIKFVIHTQSSFMRLFSNNQAHEASLGVTYKLADAIITLNECDADFWLDVNPNTHLVQNPLTLMCDENISCTRETKQIIWVGRLCMGEKCPDEAIKIMSYVHELEPDAKLIFVGADNDEHTAAILRGMVRDAGLAACIEFVGEVNNVADYLRASSIFLLTSRYEGYCLALAESKAVGLPCVMYEMPYLTLTKGNRGIVSIAQKDAKAAAYAICDILNDEQEYNRLSNEALAHAKELCAYNYEAKWRDIFKSLEMAAAASSSTAHSDAWDKTDVLSFGAELAAKDHAEEVRYLHCEIDARDVRLSEAKQHIEKLEGELHGVRDSKSFKLGVAITALPRKVKEHLRTTHQQT